MKKLKDSHLEISVIRLSLERSKQIGDVHLVKNHFKNLRDNIIEDIKEYWEDLDSYSVYIRGPSKEKMEMLVNKFKKYPENHSGNFRWDVKVTEEKINYDEHVIKKFQGKTDADLNEKLEKIAETEEKLGKERKYSHSLNQKILTLETQLKRCEQDISVFKEINETPTQTDMRAQFEKFRKKKNEEVKSQAKEHEQFISKMNKEHSEKISKLKKDNLVDVARFSKNIDQLEKKVSDRDNYIEEYDKEVSDLQDKISNLNTQIENLQSELKTLRNQNSSLETDYVKKSVFGIAWGRFRNLFRSN